MLPALKEVYHRLRFGKSIVVVSGLPRSGTSMMMRMLEAGGVEIMTDEQRAADVDNPRGYFELERVKELDKGGDKSWLDGARGKAVKIISFLLRELPPDYHCKVIFMRRSIDEIIASQNKMLERRNESNETSDEEVKRMFETHLWRVNYLLKHDAHLDFIDVHYKDALDDPAREAARVKDFLGADLDLDRMAGAVEQQLYRNRSA